MDSLTPAQIQQAFLIWYRNYEHQVVDRQVGPFLADNIFVSEGGWLRKVRRALFLSTGQVAEKLQISRAAYAKLEIKEQSGAATIKTLAEAAEALDCELIYALRPKQKKRFSEIIWRKITPVATTHSWVKSRSEKLKGRALAATAQWTMDDPEFRRKQNWSERRSKTVGSWF